VNSHARIGTGTLVPTVAAMLVAAAVGGGTPAGALAQPGAASGAAGVITTIAGGVGGPGPATKVPVDACGLLPAAGHLYIGSQTIIRQVSEQSSWLTTPYGYGGIGPLGDGGLASKASFDTCGLALDHAGNMVIADILSDRVRVIAASTGTFYGQAMRARDIYTVAGGGTQQGNGVPATSAALGLGSNFSALHSQVAVDGAGNLIIVESGAGLVRVVAESTGTFYGQPMTAGDIYTIAGDGTAGYSGDGGPGTSAEVNIPTGVTVDKAGNVIFADTGNYRIRVVAASTGTFYGIAMTAGDIYTVAGNGTGGDTGDGGSAINAELADPSAVAVDAAGDLLIGVGAVRVVAASTGTRYGQAMTAGDIYTVTGLPSGIGPTGLGGPAARATLYGPEGVSFDGAGNLFIAAADSLVLAVPAASGTFYGQAVHAGGLYSVAGNLLDGFAGDGGPATQAELNEPRGIATDAAGNMIIADTNNNRIRVVAARTGTFYGQAMTAADIYTVAGNGKTQGIGNDGPATQAELNSPGGVTVDAVGNLVIADTFHKRIRVVAENTGTFYGQHMITGDIYTVAGDNLSGYSGDGGPATKASLSFPGGIAVDGAGNLVIADTRNARIRVVAQSTGTFYGIAMTAGDIYTVAGDGEAVIGKPGNGGLASAARLEMPMAVAVDGAGNLLIADTYRQAVQVVAASTGSFYGQRMTAGHIYTVAGNGTEGFYGDGGRGVKSEVYYPYGVAASPAGNLVIADTQNGRVRMVTG
jgi:trimeric autotransporter adhesin